MSKVRVGLPRRESDDPRPWASRLLHRVNEISAMSGAAAVAAGVSAAFFVGALLSGHPSGWLSAFQSIAGAVTLVMVFALQHTQVRHQAAVQRKLDEILRALPETDSRLVHVETASQSELDALDEEHELVRHEAMGTAGNDRAGNDMGAPAAE